MAQGRCISTTSTAAARLDAAFYCARIGLVVGGAVLAPCATRLQLLRAASPSYVRPAPGKGRGPGCAGRLRSRRASEARKRACLLSSARRGECVLHLTGRTESGAARGRCAHRIASRRAAATRHCDIPAVIALRGAPPPRRAPPASSPPLPLGRQPRLRRAEVRPAGPMPVALTHLRTRARPARYRALASSGVALRARVPLLLGPYPSRTPEAMA